MKVRLYFPAHLDVELSEPESALAAAVLERANATSPDDDDDYPNPQDEQRLEGLSEVFAGKISTAEGGDLTTGGMDNWSAICRQCGCSEEEACNAIEGMEVSGCYWVEPDLCSACVLVSQETPS